tara:strand:+ start:1072 stop:1437 length:366 start_codon:yes stop_codon:yes gene_type:complete
MAQTKNGGLYVPDPNNAEKQVPAGKPDNYFDRTAIPSGSGNLLKTPNHVYVKKTCTTDIKFFFGTSASHAEQSDYSKYEDFGKLTIGTKLDIHPCAMSASATDAGNIVFVYKGGPDGSGRS